MNDKVNGRTSNILGWFTTIAMTMAAAALLWTFRLGQQSSAFVGDFLKVSAMTDRWREFVEQVSSLAGSAWAWIILGATILILFVSGPISHVSRGWMSLVTTGTSIVTLIMVFIILKTRNRHTKTLTLKLDQLQRTINRMYRRRHIEGRDSN